MLDDSIRVFLAVVEKKSFSKAAKSLFLTQPAVSFQIQMLEEYFGARLFDRTNRSVVLTSAGHLFLKYVEQMNSLQEELENEMQDLVGTTKGRLLIGASSTVGEYIVPYLLGPYKARFPEVEIALEIGNTEDMVERIHDTHLDLAIVEGSVTNKEIEQEILLKDELVLITSLDHPLAGKEKVSVFDLINYPFIMREKGSGTRQEMEQALKKVNFPYKQLKVVLELGSTSAIKRAVETGVGISIISKWATKLWVEKGRLAVVEFDEQKFERDFIIINHRKKYRTHAVEEFLKFIKSKEIFTLLK